MEDYQREENKIHEEFPSIKITRNDMRNSCTATAYNLHEIFTCDICGYKDTWNCVSLKLTDILEQREK